MKTLDFIICYDISNPARLRKISRLLEKVAIRIQKSIFFYPKCSSQNLSLIIEQIEKIIDQNQDDVRIYKVYVNKSINLRSAIDLKYPIIAGDKTNDNI
jgi:CRISPR-associated protein Cas2